MTRVYPLPAPGGNELSVSGARVDTGRPAHDTWIPVHWVVDGNNVFGSRPDGWWRDRAGAARRLVDDLARWQAGHHDPVDVVFDGRRRSWADRVDTGGVGVEFAGHADDRIVALATELVASGTDVRVVTSDRGLRARLPSPVDVMGAGRFSGLLDR